MEIITVVRTCLCIPKRRETKSGQQLFTVTVSFAFVPLTEPTAYAILNAGESVIALYVDDALELYL